MVWLPSIPLQNKAVAETAVFTVEVEGTTATVVLKESFEFRRVEGNASYHENEDGETVTLNVEVVPGLYYAADSAASIR